MREATAVRVPVLAQPSVCAQTARGPSFAHRTKLPDLSASACLHKDGRNQCASVSVIFPGERGRLRLLDRVPCMQGGRWHAASECAPLSPYEGSSPPRELRPRRKLKSAPAAARVSHCVPIVYAEHSETAMRAAATNAKVRVNQYCCAPKPNADSHGRQKYSRCPRQPVLPLEAHG